MLVAGPATTVAVTVAGATPVTVAVNVWLPIRLPSCQTVWTFPLASVTPEEGLSAPPWPWGMAKATATSGIPPSLSVTRITTGIGRMLPTWPFWLLPLTAAIEEGTREGPSPLLQLARRASATALPARRAHCA